MQQDEKWLFAIIYADNLSPVKATEPRELRRLGQYGSFWPYRNWQRNPVFTRN